MVQFGYKLMTETTDPVLEHKTSSFKGGCPTGTYEAR